MNNHKILILAHVLHSDDQYESVSEAYLRLIDLYQQHKLDPTFVDYVYNTHKDKYHYLLNLTTTAQDTLITKKENTMAKKSTKKVATKKTTAKKSTKKSKC